MHCIQRLGHSLCTSRRRSARRNIIKMLKRHFDFDVTLPMNIWLLLVTLLWWRVVVVGVALVEQSGGADQRRFLQTAATTLPGPPRLSSWPLDFILLPCCLSFAPLSVHSDDFLPTNKHYFTFTLLSVLCFTAVFDKTIKLFSANDIT